MVGITRSKVIDFCLFLVLECSTSTSNFRWCFFVGECDGTCLECIEFPMFTLWAFNKNLTGGYVFGVQTSLFLTAILFCVFAQQHMQLNSFFGSCIIYSYTSIWYPILLHSRCFAGQVGFGCWSREWHSQYVSWQQIISYWLDYFGSPATSSSSVPAPQPVIQSYLPDIPSTFTQLKRGGALPTHSNILCCNLPSSICLMAWWQKMPWASFLHVCWLQIWWEYVVTCRNQLLGWLQGSVVTNLRYFPMVVPGGISTNFNVFQLVQSIKIESEIVSKT